MENFEQRHLEARKVNSESIRRFFKFKKTLRTAKNSEEVKEVCESFGVDFSDLEISGHPYISRKSILEKYIASRFPQSSSEKEQQEKIDKNVEKLTTYLENKKAKSIVWVGGSYGTGKVQGINSDLDVFAGLPKLSNQEDREKEADIFQSMSNIGFVIPDSEPFQDIATSLESGRGLVRLSGMTEDGVGIDFHGIGMLDLQDIEKISPGFVERISPTETYEEERTSFTGSRGIIPKGGKKIDHYQKIGPEVFKGFYPDNFSVIGELVYDPEGIGSKIEVRVWMGLVKGFLHHYRSIH